jgi:hypothetical protein
MVQDHATDAHLQTQEVKVRTNYQTTEICLGLQEKMRGKRFHPELNLVCSPERPSVVVTSCPAGNFRALIVVVLK